MTETELSTDERYMARALVLAKKGLLTSDPNPCVGAVVVNRGEIVGEGWHKRAGGNHAEVEALCAAGERARGATVYVTLEPCCHYGKTPPCTKKLIESGVHRVVAAMRDPNPKVAGQGFQVLAEAGIETRDGVLNPAAESLNRGFCRRMQTGKPYVTSKLAMSLDGRTALGNGASQWITGDSARRDVHWMRARSSAVMTGIGTVIADDPMLNARLDLSEDELKQPLRVVLDSQLRVPVDAKIREPGSPVLILTLSRDQMRKSRLENAGFKVVSLQKNSNGQLDLFAVMAYLGELGVNELMVEAGPTLNGALLASGLVDEWVVYQSGNLLGQTAQPLVNLPTIDKMSDRYELKLLDCVRIGSELKLRYQVGHSVLGMQQ